MLDKTQILNAQIKPPYFKKQGKKEKNIGRFVKFLFFE